jgi:opacity protein-like surface antigen
MPAAEARADWLITPFTGLAFGAETSLLTVEVDAHKGRHWLLGGSGGWLSDRILGVEADLVFVPGFFQGDDDLVLSSSVTTVFGSVIAAVPLSVSRESLRPYIAGGLGLVRVHMEDKFQLTEDDSSLGLQFGGGALGFITGRTGMRFDLRHIRSLARATDPATGARGAKLSFWRATVGVTFRY